MMEGDGENDTSENKNPDEDDDDIGDLGQQFHNTVREKIIFLLFFLLLCMISWTVIGAFLRKREKDRSEDNGRRISPPPLDDDESVVYRICFWLCVFSLSIAMGAALLLPISIVANEVLLVYPKTYYVQWLNEMLIHGLWNLIFLFANLSLFILLPFAYLFIESEGFSGHKKGLTAKVYEALVILVLVGFAIWGICYVLAAILSPERSVFGFGGLACLGFSDQLPFIYSCISLIGVLLLLVCTPLGFAHLFTVLSQLLVGPQFLRNLEEEFTIAKLQLESLRCSLTKKLQNNKDATSSNFSYRRKNRNLVVSVLGLDLDEETDAPNEEEEPTRSPEYLRRYGKMTSMMSRDEGDVAELQNSIQEKEDELIMLDQLRKIPGWKRNLLYPLSFLLVLVLTALTVFMVIINTLQLLFGVKALPLHAQTFSLGLSSMSILGPWGAALEVIIIVYLMTTSLIGLYNLPIIRDVRPKIGETQTSAVIYNCGLVLILTSALPVLARILGITNFDLLGNFGKIEWLGNFYIVLLYNIVFSSSSALCLVTKFTSAIRKELMARLKNFFRFRFLFSGGNNLGSPGQNVEPPLSPSKLQRSSCSREMQANVIVKED